MEALRFIVLLYRVSAPNFTSNPAFKYPLLGNKMEPFCGSAYLYIRCFSLQYTYTVVCTVSWNNRMSFKVSILHA